MKIMLNPISATGYTVEYTVECDGQPIGTVDRSARDRLWYFDNGSGGHGTVRTRDAAIEALLELAGMTRETT